MFNRYSYIKIYYKLKKKFTFKGVITDDEQKVIALVKNLANNNSTTILVLPGEKISAYNGKINILLEWRKIEIADQNEYYEIQLGDGSFGEIYDILVNIVKSRIRQTEKTIVKKKHSMIDKMIIDAKPADEI